MNPDFSQPAVRQTAFGPCPGGHFSVNDCSAGILDAMPAPGLAGFRDVDRQAVDL